MIYYLMHRDDAVAMLDIGIDGAISRIGKRINADLTPLQDRTNHNGIVSWWRDRAIPIGQGKVETMLRDRGFVSPGEYLIKNLGLSLTDCYWIKPVNASFTWKDVNLFDNDFKDNLLIGTSSIESDVYEYSPNSSLQGTLEKTWIIDNGQRKLIKGNHDELSVESINEYIISNAHTHQGFDEHVDYALVHIEGKDYDYGCISDIFTSKTQELVSAYAVISSEPKPNHLSTFEHFIAVCAKNGLDENYVRQFLDYQAKMDYVFSNRDRHLTNISVIRDPSSLKFISMAPIYDSGKSMQCGKEIRDVTQKYVNNLEATGFAKKEGDMLKLVGNDRVVNIDMLPTSEDLRYAYERDSKLNKLRLDFMLDLYERKREYLDSFMK